MSRIRLIAILVLFAMLTACKPANERGLIGAQESCIRANNTGTCRGTFDQVLGENLKNFENIFVPNETAIYLDMEVKSTDGAMTFAVRQYGIEEEWKTIDVAADTPGVFSGWVIPDENGNLAIRFWQNGKTRTGKVSYTFSYSRN